MRAKPQHMPPRATRWHIVAAPMDTVETTPDKPKRGVWYHTPNSRYRHNYTGVICNYQRIYPNSHKMYCHPPRVCHIFVLAFGILRVQTLLIMIVPVWFIGTHVGIYFHGRCSILAMSLVMLVSYYTPFPTKSRHGPVKNLKSHAKCSVVSKLDSAEPRSKY